MEIPNTVHLWWWNYIFVIKAAGMNLPLRIARRYLFAKKSTNAINIITGIAVFGLCVGTAAMILVLSVFNGFEDLISSMYSNLNPDLLITPEKGKTFEVSPEELKRIQGLNGVQVVSRTLEEKAYFDARGNQVIGILKGVDENFTLVNNIAETIKEGNYKFQSGDRELAVVGFGMRSKLGIDIQNPLSYINVYMVKKRQVGPFEQPFVKRILFPEGTFFIEPEFNNNYILSSLEFAQELLRAGDAISALEIRLHRGYEPRLVQQEIEAILGEGFLIRDRYAQNEAFLKLMQVEKWLSFAIVGLMLLLVAFNLIGALWMVVLEKQKDIAILKSMGAPDRSVQRIFLNQGMLLSLFGLITGSLLALLFFFIQKQFSIIGIPGSFSINAYPISLRWMDFVVVAFTVMGIGLLASVMPAQRARRVPALIREE